MLRQQTDSLKLLNYERLLIRRLHFDLLCCYKVIFGLVCTDREALSCRVMYKLYKMSPL